MTAQLLVAVTEPVVGAADDGALLDAGDRGDRVLHLDRVHVAATGDDHVLEPIDEGDVAVVVDRGEVSGV